MPGRTRAALGPMRLRLALGAFVVVQLLVACGPAASGSPRLVASGSAAPPTPLTVGLGYIPSVQFAQFYLAQQAGYYRDAGLQVTFQNKIDPDLVTLVGQGTIDVGISDGTSVIPAVSQGIPVRYVATIYAQFPNVVYAKQASGIKTAGDLRGRKLGTPGKYGSSWIMLQALLSSAGLRPSDLNIELYPDFGQGAALAQGAVDAATGFINNEPVQLELSGTRSTVLRVDQAVPLPGNGLIAGTSAISSKATQLRAFIAATLRAMQEIEANPQKGLDAAIAAVPALGQDRRTQLAILKATIGTWSSDYTAAHGAGAVDQAAWAKTVTFMASLSDSPISGTPPGVPQLIDTSLLPS